MKKKIKKIIMMLLTIFLISVLIFIMFTIYNEFNKVSETAEINEFSSNIIISSDNNNNNNNNKSDISENIEINLNKLENDNKLDSNIIDIKVDTYFYEQLNQYSKIIYNALKNSKENMKSGIYKIELGNEISSLLYKTNGEELLKEYYQAALEAYAYDNVDVFYIDFRKLSLNIEKTTKGKNVTYKLFLNSGNAINYLTDEFKTQEDVKTALNEVEKVKEYCIQNKKENTYENVKFAHDYLIQNVEYDQSVSQKNIYNLYGALINNKSVCEGYAKAFKYLMDALEVPCVIVSGTATNSDGQTESHAWNYVFINNDWYGVDCTWDDPILVGSAYLSDSLKYKYFLKGQNEFNKTHTAKGQFTENSKEFEFPILCINNYNK